MSALAAPPRPTGAPVAVSSTRARLDAGVRLSALVGLWLSLLLVTSWWATGGGVQDLGGWTSGLTSTGRLTGLLASDLLLVQVLLMARVPVLEHAFGQDRLARVHRLVGFTSFNAMLAHIALVTWGYAAGDLLSTPGELWQLTWDYPGMLLAVAGTAVCLSAGGDMTCGTLAPDGPPWRIGVADPADPRRVVAVVPVRAGAVATSGTAHRGEHLVDARTGRPPSGVASVTVVTGSLTWADIDATAAYAHGREAARWLATRPGRSGLVVWDDGTTTTVEPVAVSVAASVAGQGPAG